MYVYTFVNEDDCAKAQRTVNKNSSNAQ